MESNDSFKTFVESWINQLKENSVNDIAMSFEKLKEMIVNTGVEIVTLEFWFAEIETNVDKLVRSIQHRVYEHQHLLENEIEELLEKAAELCKKLNIKVPPFGIEKLSLLEEKKILEQHISKYKEILKSRQDDIPLLQEKMTNVCFLLGKEPIKLCFKSLMDEEILVNYKGKIMELENEKNRRVQEFSKNRKEIIEIAEKINYEPNDDLKRDILSHYFEPTILSEEFMSKVERFLFELKSELLKIECDCKLLKDSLKDTWIFLDEDRERCNQFLDMCDQNNYEVLETLKKEMRRCEILIKANVENSIEKANIDLSTIWDLCYVNDEERNHFNQFLIMHHPYRENMLNFLKLEFVEWNKFLQSNSVIIYLLHDLDKMYLKLKELQHSSLGKGDTRFKNRGGQLLKEERKLNAYKKRIKELEEQLRGLAVTYLKINQGKPVAIRKRLENFLNTNNENDLRKTTLKSSISQKTQNMKTTNSTLPKNLKNFRNVSGRGSSSPKIVSSKAKGGISRYSFDKKNKKKTNTKSLTKSKEDILPQHSNEEFVDEFKPGTSSEKLGCPTT